jgi:hypothetical protein
MIAGITTLVILVSLVITFFILGVLFLIGTFNNRAMAAANKLAKALLVIFRFISNLVRTPFKTHRSIKNSSKKKRKKLKKLFFKKPLKILRFLNRKNGQ